MRNLALAATLAGAAMISASMVAAAAPGPNLSGLWAFETQPYREGSCKLTGTMVMRPGPRPGSYTCTMVANESCEGIAARAEQTCTAELDDDGVLSIQSSVTRYTPTDIDYLPDDFQLDKVSASRMEGTLESAAIAPVVFVRPDPAIS